MNQAQSRLAAMEWACLILVTLGFNKAGAKMPAPRRFAGVLLSFFVFGLVAEMGRSAERIATAMAGTLTIALLMNKAISGNLFSALGQLAGYFGVDADPPPVGGGDDAGAWPGGLAAILPVDGGVAAGVAAANKNAATATPPGTGPLWGIGGGGGGAAGRTRPGGPQGP